MLHIQMYFLANDREAACAVLVWLNVLYSSRLFLVTQAAWVNSDKYLWKLSTFSFTSYCSFFLLLIIDPLKVKVAVSPLVSRRTPATVRKPPQTALATTTATVANTGMVENAVEDVSSPAAARARTAMVNSSFVANIKTPVSLFHKMPHIPLQKAVLLSAGEWVGTRGSEWEKEGGSTCKREVGRRIFYTLIYNAQLFSS